MFHCFLFPLNVIPCSNLTIKCNGNSLSSPPLLDEAGAAGGGGGGGTAEAAVAEIEMEGEEGPVALDLPDIRKISIINNLTIISIQP